MALGGATVGAQWRSLLRLAGLAPAEAEAAEATPPSAARRRAARRPPAAPAPCAKGAAQLGEASRWKRGAAGARQRSRPLEGGPQAAVEEQQAVLLADRRLCCSLRWRAPGAGAGPALGLTAHLAGEGGLHIGSVGARLGREAPDEEARLIGCGVQHHGGWEDHTDFWEESIDLAMALDHSVVDHVFLHAGPRGGHGGAPTLEDVSLRVASLDGGDELLSVHLPSSPPWGAPLAAPGGAVVALLTRTPGGWFVAPVVTPCGPRALQEESIQETLRVLVHMAEARAGGPPPRGPPLAATLLVEPEEEDDTVELPSPVASPAASQAGGFPAEWQPAAEDGAPPAEWQPAAATAPAEPPERAAEAGAAGGARPPAEDEGQLPAEGRTPRAKARARAKQPGGPGWPASEASDGGEAAELEGGAVGERPAPAAAQRTLGGLHEPVSEAGYEAVAGLQDVAAMKAFIQRAAQQAGGRVEDCGWLDALAASHAGAPAGLAALLEELTVCISPPSLPREVGGGPGALPEPDSLEGPALLHMDPGLLPLSPASGSCRGGATLRWAGAGPPPRCVLVDGWACAELAGGLFVVPLCRSCPPEAEAPVLVDVAVVLQDGQGILFEGAFAYWVPGRVLAVEPPHGAPAGGDWVRVTTSSLAAPITAVRIAGQACELSAGASEAEAVVLVPPRRTEGRARLEGAVMVEVVAANGNGAALEAGFVYRQPEAFGLVGDRVDLSHGSTAATRRDGVCGGVLLGAFPARRVAGGRYFELRVDAVCKSTRTLAVGFTACRPGEVAAANGRVRAEEARELERAWLVGYERRGALLLCDGREFPVPPSCWRPKSQVAAGARIGVLWAEGQAGDQPPALCIFQDGEERARLPVGGRLPEPGEDIFALVDLQGSVKGVSLVEGAMPPAPAGTISTASTGS